jgi:glycosyltransferase involved in cell wall biosynthesis
MLDFCLRRSTLCLTTGQAGRTSLIEHGVPVERAFALPFAIDVEGMQRDVASARQRRAEIRLELGVGPRDTLFLFVGRMVPNKAPDLFVAAAGRCATENAAARFAMVGGGALEQKVGDQVRSLGLTDRLVTLGARPPGALPDFWAAADFYVLPSRFDPWPVVLLDAMAAGVPVIGSEGCGSVRDVLVDGQQGWKVPADDVDALSRAMIHAAQTSPKQRSVLSEDAARTAARFDARVVAGEFTAVVEAALQKVRTTAD